MKALPFVLHLVNSQYTMPVKSGTYDICGTIIKINLARHKKSHTTSNEYNLILSTQNWQNKKNQEQLDINKKEAKLYAAYFSKKEHGIISVVIQLLNVQDQISLMKIVVIANTLMLDNHGTHGNVISRLSTIGLTINIDTMYKKL
jgi:hypothetical protein